MNYLITILVSAGVIGGLWWVGSTIIKFNQEHPCISSHTEVEYQQPVMYHVSFGEGGGGISIPIGNIKQVEHSVCDERA